MMMRTTWILISMALVFGCDEEGTTPDVDSGTVTPGVDSGTVTPGVDSGTVTPGVDSGTVTPGVDSGTPGVDSGTVTPASTWVLRDHPCVGNRTDALFRDTDGTMYVGCGSTTVGTGLFVSADDGVTWDRPTSTPNGFFDTWRVQDVSRSADGLLYVAGIDTASSRRVVSADTSGASWALEEVYNAGSVVGSAFTVGTFRRMADGRAVAESLNGTDIQARASDADEWQDVSSWDDSFGGLQILDMEIHDGGLYGCGSTISNPPYLFLPRAPDATGFGFRVINLAGTGIGAFRGEMWGIDVDDSGIVVAGVNQDRDVGMIYALDGPDDETLSTFDVSTLFPDTATWMRGVCRRGETIMAVGERQADSIGVVLRSTNNGGSWTNVTPVTPPSMSFPPVHRCVIAPSGQTYVAGADGMIAVHTPD